MGTLGVEIGTGESFNKTSDPAADTAEVGNATGIAPFFTAFCKYQFLVSKPFHLLIHDNTGIDY